MVERSPFFCFIRGGWVPAILTRNVTTGFLTVVEGPDAFTTGYEADEASRFLRADGENGRVRPRPRSPALSTFQVRPAPGTPGGGGRRGGNMSIRGNWTARRRFVLVIL